MKRTLFAVAVSLFAATPALAQTPQPRQSKRAPEVTYQKVTVLKDFDDDQIEGEFPNPDGRVVEGRRSVTFRSMLHPRTSFVPEMMKSVEDL